MRGGCAKKFCLQYKGNAIYIGKMQERSPREKSSNACIESSLWTSSLKDYLLLENSLGMSLWQAPRILSLMMGDKKTFHYLLFFWESNSNVEDAIAVDALASFGNI